MMTPMCAYMQCLASTILRKLDEIHLRVQSARTGPHTPGFSAKGLCSGCTTPLTCSGSISV